LFQIVIVLLVGESHLGVKVTVKAIGNLYELIWLSCMEAMRKEVKDQSENRNFSIVKRLTVPEGVIMLPTVWQMKRKRDIKTREIKKYNVRLNIYGSKMEKGVHYSETYAPVASWNTI
jgi:hypothetical protein